MMLEAWSEAAEAEQDATISLRRAIHAEPELGLNCPQTTAKLKAALAGLPLDIRDSQQTSGFIARLDGARPGRTVLLRGDMDALPIVEETGLDFASRTGEAVREQLALTYGRDCLRVLALAHTEPELAQPVAPGAMVIQAQVAYAVREEMALTLSDVVARRTPLGAAGHPGRAVVAGCAAVMARECGWSPARTAQEIAGVTRFYAPAAVELSRATAP
jgi:hypothetical protein